MFADPETLLLNITNVGLGIALAAIGVSAVFTLLRERAARRAKWHRVERLVTREFEGSHA